MKMNNSVPTTPGTAFNPSVSTDVYSCLEVITPKRASELLEKNTDNRQLSESVVESYADMLKNGQWVLTHQGIAVGKDGLLYDGQHRLMAITKTGIAAPMHVTYNLVPEARAYVDAGRKRTVADNFRIASKDASIPHSRIVETANVVYGLIHKKTTFQSTMGIVDDLITGNFREGILWAARLTRSGRKMPAPVRGALALAYRDDPTRVREFSDKLISGLNIDSATHPVKVLSNLLDATRVQGNGNSRRELAVKTLRAVYAFLYEKKLTKLYETEDAVVFFARAHGLKLKHVNADTFRQFVVASGKYSKG